MLIGSPVDSEFETRGQIFCDFVEQKRREARRVECGEISMQQGWEFGHQLEIRGHTMMITRTIASSIAVLLVAGTMVPVTANAWPLGKKANSNAAATQTQETRISVQVHNKSKQDQSLKVEGQVYTVPAHQTLTIKAPLGTTVYADSVCKGHIKGDQLFSFTKEMKDATFSID